jgi:hypothetical protein
MTQLPHQLKRIRLNLARSKECPNGSSEHGYEFVAPLDADDHIDLKLWHEYHEHCRVRRFWGDEEEVGRLVHRPRGHDPSRWLFDYNEESEDDDEVGYRFAAHAFRLGEYVSIRDQEAELHTFKVVSVEFLS